MEPLPDASESSDMTASPPRVRRRGVNGSIWALEHSQDFLTIAVGVVLIVLAATLIISGGISFTVDAVHQSVSFAAINLLDRVLLVLILVEIVHTVVLSLQAHRLVAQPFIIVGLVAVIRRILFLLSNQATISSAELGLLIAMVVAFIAGLIAISHFEKRDEWARPRRAPDPRPSGGKRGAVGGFVKRGGQTRRHSRGREARAVACVSS